MDPEIKKVVDEMLADLESSYPGFLKETGANDASLVRLMYWKAGKEVIEEDPIPDEEAQGYLMQILQDKISEYEIASLRDLAGLKKEIADDKQAVSSMPPPQDGPHASSAWN
jgi:hypothetical protein